MKYCALIFFFLFIVRIQAQDQPNVVLILADDLGYGDVGCYGSRDIKTPNIDRLATEGVRFSNFYSNGPECSPTRAALLSGLYQQRIGGLECAIGAGNIGRYDEAAWLVDKKELGLPREYCVLPRELKKAGYNTAIIGKWHLGYEEKFRPHNQFFDYSFGTFGIGGEYFYHVERGPINLDDSTFTGIHTLMKNGKETFRDGYYSTHLFTDEARAWLNQQNNKTPFFLYLPYTAPHTPFQGPNDFSEKPFTNEEWGTRNKSRKTYAEMVEEMDKGIGQVLDVLERKGLAKNTIVIFFSDNGGTKMSDNGVFSGYKGQVYEGGIRVPCIIKWPSMIPENSASDQASISFDLTLSIIARAGADISSLDLDGYDILSHVIDYKTDFDRTLFWRKKREESVVKAVRDGSMKLVVEYESDVLKNKKLYNLKTDPCESADLAEANPQMAKKLFEKLSGWEKEVQSERLSEMKK
ncbi:N-acetylgalactosamine-6-sulfatase [Mariniphaga anaerophila]|uniref:N-acetylgalactosamine-6-sulfatase n=1 Tax=Mariniphaga anaerophila TaxID=1484053 RepID=A0A1M5DKV8_9BACT|nr:sulfatase-like hydrolase/transferase [Mariniphaga anaerophila]SHF67639.1 N-acetylgalactosamine-6-sulfatase [Mariniphaga anaerophila]